jgi:hypothetical protein
MSFFRIAVFILTVLLLSSCKNPPTGTYEGKLENNYVILDFTTKPIVIVKTASILEIPAVNMMHVQPKFDKRMAYWVYEDKKIVVKGDDGNRIYCLKKVGKNFIDTKTGEYLLKKHLDVYRPSQAG